MAQRFYIIRHQSGFFYYKWSDELNDHLWTPNPREATQWTSKRSANRVRVTVGGQVIPGEVHTVK